MPRQPSLNCMQNYGSCMQFRDERLPWHVSSAVLAGSGRPDTAKLDSGTEDTLRRGHQLLCDGTQADVSARIGLRSVAKQLVTAAEPSVPSHFGGLRVRPLPASTAEETCQGSLSSLNCMQNYGSLHAIEHLV